MLKWLLLAIQFMLVVSSTHQLSECFLVHRKIKVFVYAMAFCNALILAFKWLKKKLEAWIKVEHYPCTWISYLLWMISVPLIWPIRLKEKPKLSSKLSNLQCSNMMFLKETPKVSLKHCWIHTPPLGFYLLASSPNIIHSLLLGFHFYFLKCIFCFAMWPIGLPIVIKMDLFQSHLFLLFFFSLIYSYT